MDLELKLDGYRLLVSIDRGKVRLVTKSGRDWTDRMPALVGCFKALKVDAAEGGGQAVRTIFGRHAMLQIDSSEHLRMASARTLEATDREHQSSLD